MMKPGKDRGWEVIVINHNTGTATQLKDLKTVCGPNIIWPIGICAALLIGSFSTLEFFPAVLFNIIACTITFVIWDKICGSRANKYLKSTEFQSIQSELEALTKAS